MSTLNSMPSTQGLWPTGRAGMGRTAVYICATAVLFLTLLLAASPRAEAAKKELAIQDEQVFVRGAKNPYDRDKAFQQVKKLGVSWMRINVLWAYVAAGHANDANKPADPQYAFGHIEEAIHAAATQGIKVELAIAGPPPRWANGRKASPFGSKNKAYKPDVAEYAEFVRIVTAHFKGLVKRIIVNNEVNHVSWLAPLKDGPQIYRDMYIRAYNAIKQVDPSIQVLFGALAPHKSRNASAPLDFLRKAMCVNRNLRKTRNCETVRVDGFAQHTYDFDNPPNVRRKNPDDITLASLNNLTRVLDRLRALNLLVQNGGGKIDVYSTEHGVLLKRGKRSGRGVDEKTRARYLGAGARIALRNPRLKQLLQFLLVKPQGRSGQFNTALLDAKKREGPTFRALAKLRSKFAKPAAPFTLPPAGSGGNPSSPPSSGGGDGGVGNPLCPPVCP